MITTNKQIAAIVTARVHVSSLNVCSFLRVIVLPLRRPLRLCKPFKRSSSRGGKTTATEILVSPNVTKLDNSITSLSCKDSSYLRNPTGIALPGT